MGDKNKPDVTGVGAGKVDEQADANVATDAAIKAAEDALLAATEAAEAAEREANERIALAQQAAEVAEREANERIAKAAQQGSKKPRVAISNVVQVGCRLPNGIILEHPLNPNEKVELRGVNKTRIIGAPYGVTEVSRDFWEMWVTVNANFAPVKSGAIFAASSASDVEIVANEVSKERTGFEQMPQDAMGVKVADKE